MLPDRHGGNHADTAPCTHPVIRWSGLPGASEARAAIMVAGPTAALYEDGARDGSL